MPWTKLFDKVLGSDIYVAYDSVQYTRTEFHSRQRITGRDGPVWLSVPVLTRGRGRQPLHTVELVGGTAWRAAHLRLLTEHYRGAPYFREVMAVLEEAYQGDDGLLVDFNLRVLRALLDYVGATVRIERATRFEHGGDNTERIIQLTRAVAGDIHLTSTYGTPRRYVDWSRVAAAGIGVESQRFSEPCYRQQFEPFRAGLSVVDLLFATGPAAAELLRGRCRFDLVLAPAPAPAPAARLLLEPAAQVPGQEALGRGVELQPVFRLGEAMALVGEQHVFVLDPGFLERRHDLLRLGLLDPRVVRALGDQQRDPDVAGPGQR